MIKIDTSLTTDQQQQEAKILGELENKSLVILGLGKEGHSTYEFLRHYFPDQKIWLIDEKGLGELGENWQQVSKKDLLVEFLHHFDKNAFGDQPLHIFKTPGIPPHSLLIKQAQELDPDWDSNTNLFLRLLDIFNQNEQAIITIGVTGTKGKSTTTSLIHHTLATCGLHTFLGGNIGTPPLSLWQELRSSTTRNQTGKPTTVVLELSSHQLAQLDRSPNIAVILNIVPEHLDYYQIFEHYIDAKASIAKYQNVSDYLVINQSHSTVAKIAKLSPGTQISFDPQENIQDNWLTWKSEKIVDLDTVPLVGKHNIENMMPAIIIAKHFSCPTEKITQSIQAFKPLPHRLELIAKVNLVSYYNDSLATNPEATMAAIESFPNLPIILIAGGFDRRQDFSKLAQAIIDHQVKHLILFPDTGEKILEAVKQRFDNNMGETQFTQVASMAQAVEKANKVSSDGDVVLMSPASASFNLFKDYADRGDQFRKEVGKLVAESGF